jgi:hypothetical protein
VALAGAADDDFAVLEVFEVLLTFFEEVLTFLEEVVADFVAIGDAFEVDVVLTVEVLRDEVVEVALLTMSIPFTLLAWPAMMGYPTS